MYSAPAFPAGSRPIHLLLPRPHFNSIEEFKDQIFWRAMDPYYSWFLNQTLQEKKPEDIEFIFAEVKDQVCVLMIDELGTGMIQELFRVCGKQQMDQLVSLVTADVHLLTLLCLNSHGSKAVNTFLQCLRTPKQISDMISALQRLTPRLVNDHIGCQVIGQCFDIFSAKETQPILDVIADVFFDMATNPSGSHLLWKLLNSKAFLLESHPSILSKLVADAYQLSHHPIGSLVMGIVIILSMQDLVRDIVAQLTGGFALLSMNKNATHVVLTLMREYKETYLPQIIDEIMHSPNFSIVLQDPYGKYIIEQAKKYSTETVQETLNHQILLRSDHLHSHSHGKKVLPKKKK